MAKRLVAKVGEYEKDGETKGRYVEIGVILSNNNGEYALIDPTVNLAGVLMKQRVMAQKNGVKVTGDSVMCSVFDNDKKSSPQQHPDFDDDIGF